MTGVLNVLYKGVNVRRILKGTLDGIPRVPVDGTLLREENGAVWVICGGGKFHVPDLATLSRLFLNIPLHQLWNGALNDLPTVPHDDTLLREESTSQIYVILNGNKKRLESSDVAGQVHILWDGVAQIP